jgi:hypothetical protein
LGAISLATVPVTPMTFVKFNFKFANPSKSYVIHKTRIRRFAFTLWRNTWYIIQDRQSDDPTYGERFPEGVFPSRCTFVELHLHLCEVGSD